MQASVVWAMGKVWFSRPIVWALTLGLAVRVYAAAMRTIINPDGVQYIYQAAAIYNRQWSELFTCKLNFLSPLPIFIAASFAACRDWIVASHIVNISFGTATLVPLYYLLRRFFQREVCTLTVLIYALMPVLVDGSGNVIRGPMFWFALCTGMLFFIRQWDEGAEGGRYRYDLSAAAFCFLIATWCRIEGVVFLAAPLVYLVFARSDAKVQRCGFFLLPVLLLAATAVGMALASGADLYTTLRLHQVTREATDFVANYNALDVWLRSMNAQSSGIQAEFYHRTRESLGFIPLVLVVQNILEGMFYPLALIFLIGIFGIRKRWHQDRRLVYFVWQAFAGFVVLYVHILWIWIISYRFLAVIIFPGCVVVAHGLEKILAHLHHRRRWSMNKALVFTAVALVVIALPKDLKPEESDKAVYRQAARTLAQRIRISSEAPIAAYKQSRALEWILLYTHRDSPGIPCSTGLGGLVGNDYRRFVTDLDAAGIRYLLYEERYWPGDRLDFPSVPYQADFRLLGRWHHPDSSTFMIFERKKDD